MEHSRYGRQLSNKDEKYTDKVIFEEFDGEVLHDKEGNAYELSDEYKRLEESRRVMSVGREMELQLAKELLSSDLSRLTQRQKDVMYYTMLEIPQDQIAKRLGISSSAVQQHLKAARKKLAKIIEGTKQIMIDEFYIM